MKRIGFLGDIHAEDARLAIALRELSRQSVDIIVAVGDIVDGPGDVEKTVALLREYDVSSVRGNHERWFFANQMRDLPDAHALASVSLETREWLSSLPLMFELPTSAGKLLVCHGLGADDMASILPGDDVSLIRYDKGFRALCRTSSAKFVLNGHSHKRMVRHVEDRIFINAGTLFRDHEPSFGLVDFAAGYVTTWLFAPDLSIRSIPPIPLDEPPPSTRRER
ncbi:MAG TPA: metallophosphoesterase family protein [Polyangium sp.]|nr:metallophosphoesterase family protein [Polyangium sp.]